MTGFNLDGYVTVNERMIAFFDRYPTGSIQTRPAEIMLIGDRTFIRTIAEVYRTPDDERPGIGEAWEVFPGKTPYTRDSEAMNASTSAIGRGILAVGVGFSEKGVASADEVRVAEARRSPEAVQGEKDWRGKKPPHAQKASEKQIAAIQRMLGTVPREDRSKLLKALVEKDDFEQLTNGDVDWFFQTGSAGVMERYKALKEIWADEPDDDPWAVEGM